MLTVRVEKSISKFEQIKKEVSDLIESEFGDFIPEKMKEEIKEFYFQKRINKLIGG
jgi:hypothetical protein